MTKLNEREAINCIDDLIDVMVEDCRWNVEALGDELKAIVGNIALHSEFGGFSPEDAYYDLINCVDYDDADFILELKAEEGE